jgi:DNA-binding NtrC family response regulator
MLPSTETMDPPPEGWLAWARAHTVHEPKPRLRIMLHCDLDRVGWTSAPGVVPADGTWLVVGRNDPPFVGLAPGAPRAIDDPHVSREQLRVRWLADVARFEVEPMASARRPTGRVDLGPGSAGAAVSPMGGPTLLEPGTCIAIGDRVLLALEVGRVRAAAVDRLGLVGESEALWTLRDEIRSVAQFGGSALVMGPTGAGKELVARALHEQSPRAEGPFVPVNCAALPETLAESVLFGYRKGAFTGANTDEKGLFRAAEGGTLFFDELGELPLSLQPKLLRVLQEGVVVPVGAHDGRRVDVRVVAATHRDLEAYVESGKLREDLYHRLSAHVLRVPSLAERRADVPELFVHMLGRLRAEHDRLSWLWSAAAEWRPAVPLDFVVELMRRDWRGNVRELQNLAVRTARVNLEPGAFRAPEVAESRRPPALERAAPPEPEPGSGPVSAPPSPKAAATVGPEEGLVRSAGATLGIARKTLLKLLAPSALVELATEADRLGFGEAERATRLRARAADALLTMLEARDFNQSNVAAALGTSRTTLLKLADSLGLPRAGDLAAGDIARARDGAGGDLDAAARILRVSPTALKKRVAQLGGKGPV